MIDIAALVAILIPFGALLLGAVGLGFWLGRTSRTAPYDPYRREVEYDGMFRSEKTTYEEPEVEPEEEDLPALPIDPENPPIPRTYRHQQGRPVKICHCHSRPLEDGEQVLWWPNPEVEGAFWIVCQDGARG